MGGSRASWLVFAAALVVYGALGIHWASLYPSPTLPVDAYFGLDSVARYDAVTDPAYENDRAFALHPLFAAFVKVLAAPCVAAGLTMKHVLVMLAVVASALQVAILFDLLLVFGLPAVTRAALVLAFACSYTQLIHGSAQESFVFSGLVFLMLIRHGFAVLIEHRPVSRSLLGALGVAAMGITITNVVPWAFASVALTAGADRRRSAAAPALLVVGVVAATAALAWGQRFWLTRAVWFPEYFLRGVGDVASARTVGFELQFVHAPASLVHGVVEAAENLLVLPWLFTGFTLGAAPATGMKGFFLSGTAAWHWALVAATAVLLALGWRRVPWTSAWRRFAVVVGAILVFHLALHAVYGRGEAHLYAPHYLGATAAMAGIAMRGYGGSRAAVRAGAVLAALTLVLVVNNAWELARFHGAFAGAFGRCELVRRPDGSVICR